MKENSELRANAPLLNAYLSYFETIHTPFTIPGHKQRASKIDPALGAVVDSDIPLYGGLDEIKLTGVDQYLVENPQANTQELIDYASQNKPKVFSKVLGDAEAMDEIFLPTRPQSIDPLDMTDHSIVRADDISSDLQDGSYEMDMDSVLAKFTRMKDDGVITQDQLDEVVTNATNQKEYTPFPADYLADDEIEALAEQISREDFFDDPYKLIELDEGVGLDLKAYGNDRDGYTLIQDGNKIDLDC